MEGSLLWEISRVSYRWKVIVRFARIWEFSSQDNGVLYELDFVLVDRQGGTMEGLVPSDRVAQFREKLKEGSVYMLDRFNLYDAKRTYRDVDHPLWICFTHRTLVKELVPQPEGFPMFAYNAFPFSVLAERIDRNVLLSDVVGLVTEVSEVVSAVGQNRQTKRHVYISDGREQAIVTLWGQFAESFDAAGLRDASIEEPIVVIFVGMTVGQFSGLLAFKSTSATRWYINIPIDEVASIRESTKNMPHRIEWHGSDQRQGEPIDTTIEHVSTLEPNDIMNERYRLKIRVTRVLSTKDWYYMSCKDCWKKLVFEDDKYNCPRCTDPVPTPRYRIVVHAVDADTSDASDAKMAEFTFFGPPSEAIVGKQALLVVSTSRGHADYVPPEISGLLGRCFSVVITPTDKSLDAMHTHYRVQSAEPLPDPPVGRQTSPLSTHDLGEGTSRVLPVGAPLEETLVLATGDVNFRSDEEIANLESGAKTPPPPPGLSATSLVNTPPPSLDLSSLAERLLSSTPPDEVLSETADLEDDDAMVETLKRRGQSVAHQDSRKGKSTKSLFVRRKRWYGEI